MHCLSAAVAMRVLRNGGQFSHRRGRFYFAMSLGLLVIVMPAIVVSDSFGLQALSFFGAASSLIVFKTSFRRWARWLLGRKVTCAVAETLKSLPDDYIVLNDIVLPDSKANVDYLLIGPNGIFSIETKNYSGFVKCEEDEWLINGRRIRSLSKQAKRNAIAVRGCIAQSFTGSQTGIPYVAPLLVFVGSRTKLKLFKPAVPVLRLGELVEFIRHRETKRSITQDEKRALVPHLQLLQRNFAYLSDLSATEAETLDKAG
jgi:Nuclease-related domain